MSFLSDTCDPTTALFISEGAASRAPQTVLMKYPQKVKKAEPKLRKSRGEPVGYALIIHFRDERPAGPLTNSCAVRRKSRLVRRGTGLMSDNTQLCTCISEFRT